MRLQDIRAAITDVTAYDPEVEAYTAILDRMVNDAYIRLWAADAGWTFAMKEAKVTAYGDAVPGYDPMTNLPITITLTNGSEQVVTSGDFFKAAMQGRTLLDPTDTPYVIRKAGSTIAAFLETPYAGATITTSDFRVVQVRVPMPADLVRILRIEDATEGKEILYRDRFSQADQAMSYGVTDPGSGEPDVWTQADPTRTAAPMSAPTTAAITGTLPASTWRFCYTHLYGGVESARSPLSAEHVVTTAAGIRVSVPTTFLDSGYSKNIYGAFKNPAASKEYSAFRYLGNIDDSTTTFSLATDPSVSIRVWATGNASRAPENDGYVSSIALWNRPSTDRVLRVIYLYQPPKLIEDTDSPMLPVHAHSYLVHRTLEQLFMRHDKPQYARIHAGLANEEVKELRRRYLNEERQSVRRGMSWGTGQTGRLAFLNAINNTWST